MVKVTDDHPDLSWLDQKDSEMGEGFEAHAESRKSGYGESWFMVGIMAEASIEFVTGGDGGWRMDGMTVRSPGLWGVESDSDPSYFLAVYRDELDHLAEMLIALGFETSDILAHAPEIVRDDPTEA